MPTSETVTLAGSNLTFFNTYDTGVTAAYRTAVLFAEHELQSHFTAANPITITVSFGFADLGDGFLAQNQFNNVVAHVPYTTLVNALKAHEQTQDDIDAVNSLIGLPDPSKGDGFLIGAGMARVLGLPGAVPPNATPDVRLVLGKSFTWNFDPNHRDAAGGYDAIGAIEHEITEGGFGRVGGLGYQNHQWGPLDLFRYSAAGQRDFTGGKDGKATFFSVDGTHLLTKFHSSVSMNGVFDGQDPGDWDIGGDSFGYGKPSTTGFLSDTDLRILDILGWTPVTKGAPTTDDYADMLTDKTAKFGQATVNGTITGNLEVATDRDWFAVHFNAGVSYVITLQGQQGAGGTLQDPYLRVHDGSGNLVAENDDIQLGVNKDSQLTYVAPSTGTFYIEAGAFDDATAGTYRVGVAAANPGDDYADSFTDKAHPFGQVTVNGSTAGSIDALGDRDWFAVSLVKDHTYVISELGQHAGAGTLEDSYVRLHDSAGNLLAENDDIELQIIRDSQLSFVAPSTGTFYIEAGAFDDSYKGTYRVSVAEKTNGDDFADNFTEVDNATAPAGQVVAGGTATGTLETIGDRDWFSVQMETGSTYTVSLTGQQGGGGTLEDPYLRFYNAAGIFQDIEDDDIKDKSGEVISRDSEIFVTITGGGGTFYIEAGSYADSYTGTYTISVKGPPTADDFADTLTEGTSKTVPFGQVGVGGSSTGNLEALGDRDWFSTQLTAGMRYVINQQGKISGGGTLVDSYLRLHDNTGALVAENDDIKLGIIRDSRIVFAAATTGTYYIEAGGFDDKFAGTYKISVAAATITGTNLGDTINAVKSAAGQLKPYDGVDSIEGRGGSDTISGLGGADLIDGGTGKDTASYATDTTGVTVSLMAGTASGGDAEGDVLIGIENLTGGAGDDTLEGNSGPNVLVGGGNTGAGDTLSYANALAGVTVSLAFATTQVTGGSGSDRISGFENLVGSAFDDLLRGNLAVNHLDGGANGAGGDTVSYAASKLAVTVDLSVQDGTTAQVSTGDANGDVLKGFENVIGSAFKDILTGSNTDNVIEGGAGGDQLHGGGGNDTLSYAGSGSAVTVTFGVNGELNSNGGSVLGGAKGDTGDGFENILGSAFGDKLTGNASDNIITGGKGNDLLTGGGGADQFVYTTPTQAPDRIADFGDGADTLTISKAAFGGNLTSQGVTPDTDFFVSAAGHAATETGHGQLLFDTNTHQLFWDDDGIGGHAAKLIITFTNGHLLLASEFDLV